MEFAFDDSMFDDDIEDEKKKNDTTEAYIPKYCEPFWFKDISVDSVESNKDFEIRRFQADLLYYEKKFEAALNIYVDHLKTLRKEDFGVPKRMLFSSIIQCLMKLGRHNEAIPYVKEMLECKLNPSDSNTFFLAYEVYMENRMLKEALANLQQAIAINDSLPFYWTKLGDLYKQIALNYSDSRVNNPGKENFIQSNENTVKGEDKYIIFLCASYASLLRVRFLFTELTRDQAWKVKDEDLLVTNTAISDLELLGIFDEAKLKEEIHKHSLNVTLSSASSQGKQESLIIEGDIDTRIDCFHVKWFPFSLDSNI